MTIALLVLVAVVLVAGLVLTQLDPGGSAQRRRPKASVTTSSTTAVPTTTTSKLRQQVKYTVRAGDTLSSIARQFHVTTGAIVLVNKLTNADHLTIGQSLTIPPEVPVKLTLKPPSVAGGGSVGVTLSGATPGEKVTFQIQTPRGLFTGPAHVAAPDGTVTTTYSPNAGDAPGTYLVVARGDQGTTATAALVVTASG